DPDYPTDLRRRIGDYRALYADLFRIAAARGLQVFLTTDILYFNETIRRKTRGRTRAAADYLAAACHSIFRDYPEVGGVITRIGESDGLDVEGDFISELTIRTPAQARRMLQVLLPVFEEQERTLIFRTWSVGAYRIGDLMWNRNTFHRTFDGLDSPSLVISLKYGESDFFRCLPLNRQFFRSDHRKIIEVQARREYEGFGEFPAFIGWDCEGYARQLRNRPEVIGASVWGQTGGWSVFRRLTLLEPTAIWANLNVHVAMRIFKNDATAEEAIADWARMQPLPTSPERLTRFLRLSDEVLRELLYLDEFSRRKLFFRRLRVPPLLWVYWDHIIVNHSMRKILRCFVADGEAAIRQGRAALEKIREMMEMARELGLPEADLRFQYDTFEMLAIAREYYFRPYSDEIRLRLQRMTRRYRRLHRTPFQIVLNFDQIRMTRGRMKRLIRLFVRDQRGYRLFDRIVTIRFLSWFYPLLRQYSRDRMTPDFADRQAMGLRSLFR
ncbi:MAG: hypothetical protein U1E27_12370, partial [Kiritimatiellia bacterium]|nr:hypothetical protein [Kiritimatiellia bacterium]